MNEEKVCHNCKFLDDPGNPMFSDYCNKNSTIIPMANIQSCIYFERRKSGI